MPEIQEKVRRVFESAQDQQDALFELYALFIPDWDGDVSVSGIPACGENLYRFITSLFCAFDFENHPGRPSGQLWREEGFFRDESFGNWEVSLRSNRKEKGLCFE